MTAPPIAPAITPTLPYDDVAQAVHWLTRVLGLTIALAAEDAATVDRHYQRAVAAGAQIVRPPHLASTPAFPDSSHQFDVRDPAGHLWTIGTFRPFLPADALDGDPA